MKILSTEQIRQADAYTIEHEPISSPELMERAATMAFKWIVQQYGRSRKYLIICGTGNNGGDGLVIARLMAAKNMQVQVYIVHISHRCSADFTLQHGRLKKMRNVSIIDINETDDLSESAGDEIIIDALFGSGLNKPLDGFAAEVVKQINAWGNQIISVDIPSGLFGDDNTGNCGQIIRAKHTLSFQFPKLAFMFAENEQYTGNWHVLPIGLHPDFIENCSTGNYYIGPADCAGILKTRGRFSHKGNFGHALVAGGSFGKMGAAILAASSALKTGAGLVTAHVPAQGNPIMQTALPEVMVSTDTAEHQITAINNAGMYNAIAVGPGIGQSPETAAALKRLIQETGAPLIFDADAINILGENKTWIPFVPKGSIFTPHPKEFERLTGVKADGYGRYLTQKEFSKKHGVFVILKGARTSISCPDGSCWFNPTGNPGMATAGSGDVLTGILLGFLAQGYTSRETCLLGVYLHGLAGDIAAARFGYESLTAGSIRDHLYKAFRAIRSTSIP